MGHAVESAPIRIRFGGLCNTERDVKQNSILTFYNSKGIPDDPHPKYNSKSCGALIDCHSVSNRIFLSVKLDNNYKVLEILFHRTRTTNGLHPVISKP